MNGVPTLMFRLGNERGNQIVNAQIRVVMVRTERTAEGGTFYRMLDLHSTRERALSLSRSWNVLHTDRRLQPAAGETPASLADKEIELRCMVMASTTPRCRPCTPATATSQGHPSGARGIADVLSETPDGHMLLDLAQVPRRRADRAHPRFPLSGIAQARNRLSSAVRRLDEKRWPPRPRREVCSSCSRNDAVS